MKTLLVILILTISGTMFAKDPPKKKEPHIYITDFIYNKTGVDTLGQGWCLVEAVDKKGDRVLVGLSKDTVRQLLELFEQTSVVYRP